MLLIIYFLLLFQNSLQEKLNATEGNLKSQNEAHQVQVDDLHKEVKDTKALLQDSQSQCQRLEGSLKEKNEKLAEREQKVSQLESDLKTKVDM